MSDVQESRPEMFRGEVTPREHLVQIYEDDDVFLDTLARFVAGGLLAGEGVIVIATAPHLEALESRLYTAAIDVKGAQACDQYIPVNAEERFSKISFRGWPDDYLVRQSITQLISRARGRGRKVRAFGESVALLLARGQNGAAVRLEQLWSRIIDSEAIALLCAYPKRGFTGDSDAAMREICAMHTRVC